eukprot:ctg_3001.g526
MTAPERMMRARLHHKGHVLWKAPETRLQVAAPRSAGSPSGEEAGNCPSSRAVTGGGGGRSESHGEGEVREERP